MGTESANEELRKMRFSLFDWLILGFAILAFVVLFTVDAYLEAVVVVALMVVALLLHRSINNRPRRLL